MSCPNGPLASSLTPVSRDLSLDVDDGRLYRCCACSLVLHDPVLLLDCLHNCCRQCLDGILDTSSSSAAAASGTPAACPACHHRVSGPRCKPNALLAAQIAALGLHTVPTCCDVCVDDVSSMGSDVGGSIVVAVSWCSDCQKSMCDPCSARHRVFGKGHETVALHTPLVAEATPAAVCGACLALPPGATEAAAAVTWCAECSRAFCRPCANRHTFFCKDHRTFPLCESSGRSAAAIRGSSSRPLATAVAAGRGAPVHLCIAHAKRCEFFCYLCADLGCVACVKACLEARHDVSAVTSDSALSLVQRASTEIAAAADGLRGKLSALATARPNLLGSLAEARGRDADKIKGGTKAALDLIEAAYNLAKGSLDAAYESLADRVPPTLAADADRLGRRLQCVDEYLSALVDSGDVVSLLDQQTAALACLRRLAGDAAALPPVVTDEPAKVKAEAWSLLESERLPEFDVLVQRRVGFVRPRPEASPFRPVSFSAHPASADQSQRNEDKNAQNIYQPPDRDGLLATGALDGRVAADAGAACRAFAVGAGAFVTSRSVTACHDMVATSDGRILLAAHIEGLEQYDGSTGKRLKTWYPPREDGRRSLVCSVDALPPDDGKGGGNRGPCVVVAVFNSQRIYLLCAAGSSGDNLEDWVKDDHFDLWLWPYRVAAGRRLIAIVGASAQDRDSVPMQFGPGRQLVVMSLSDGRTALELDLEFVANAVALLAESAVIVAGEQSSSGRAKHFVVAYGYGKERLWRYETELDVGDICLTLSAAVESSSSTAAASSSMAGAVCLALPEDQLVLALDAGTGRPIGEVFRASAQESPIRLSFGCGHDRKHSLVVLSVRGLVTMYPVVYPVDSNCESSTVPVDSGTVSS